MDSHTTMINDLGILAWGVGGIEAEAAMNPVFKPNGTLTAGNSSPVTDGASVVLLMSEERAANVKAWEKGWNGDPTGPVDWKKINANGSSIAIGHPWSATGGRIVTTLANEMTRRDARFGLVSICAAGGMAGAMILARP